MTNFDKWAWLKFKLTDDEWKEVKKLIEEIRREGWREGYEANEVDRADW